LIRRQRRGLDHARIGDEDAGDLLAELEHLAGVDGHLQPLPGAAETKFHRSFSAILGQHAGGSSAQQSQQEKGSTG